MPDWFETLQNFSGALSGIPKGLDLGLEPFGAWEKIRSADLANDRSDITLRDLLAQQNAREGVDEFGYYTDQAGAQQSGFQKTRAGNERDIYGIGQDMDRRRYMEDPEGAFQQMVAELGLRPEDPEYRRLAAEAASYYDPMGAIGAYDKMGVPAIEQRNMTRESVGMYLQEFARRKDPGAQVMMQDDGTFLIVGSDGEAIPVPYQQAIAAASMMGAPTNPYGTMSNVLKDQVSISNANTNAYKAANPNNTSAQNSAFTQARLIFNAELSKAESEIARIQKSPEFGMMSPDEQAAAIAPAMARRNQAQKQMSELAALQLQRGGGFGGGPAMDRFGVPRSMIAPQGGSSMTTRPPPSAMAARAAGGMGGAGGGRSRAPVPPIPGGQQSRSGLITQAQPGEANLQARIQELLQLLGQ